MKTKWIFFFGAFALLAACEPPSEAQTEFLDNYHKRVPTR